MESYVLVVFFSSFLLSGGVFSFELWVGTNDLTEGANVVVWVNSSWADGLSVGFPATYNISDMQRIAFDGELRLLGGIHANLETMQRQLFDHIGTSLPDAAFLEGYSRELPDYLFATKDAPKPFWWWCLTEDDSSGVGFPYTQLSVLPSDHFSAWSQFDSYLQRSMIFASAMLSSLNHSATSSLPDVPLVAQVGFGENSHMFFARGVDVAVIERANDDIGDLSTAIAFGRGGARQFGKAFAIDLSWWWGVVYSGVNHMPASYHKRHAYISYFAGASAVNIEGGDGLVDGSGKIPTSLGEIVQGFGEFVKSHQETRCQRALQLHPYETEIKACFNSQISRSKTSSRGIKARLGYSPNGGGSSQPVVVILPKDHGYMTKPYWSTTPISHYYARLDPRQGDSGIAAFFQTVYPGSNFAQDAFPFGHYAIDDPPASMWALSSETPQYAPRTSSAFHAASYIPFGAFESRETASEFFSQNVDLDPSPWRPMPDSRYGDIFDVAVAGLGLTTMNNIVGSERNNMWASKVESGGRNKRRTSNFAGEEGRKKNLEPQHPSGGDLPSFSGYKVALLLGPVNLTASLKSSLLEFASSGGHVILAAGVVSPDDSDLTGIRAMASELRAGRAWNWSETSERVFESFRYVPLDLSNGTVCNDGVECAVLAETSSFGNACGLAGVACPLVVQRSQGNGSVITCLIPWFVDSSASSLSLLSKMLLDSIFVPLQPVLVEGPYPVQYLLADDVETSGRQAVLVSNNDEASWDGTVTFQSDYYKTYSNCTELLTGSNLEPNPSSSSSRSFLLSVPPFDLRIVECDVDV